MEMNPDTTPTPRTDAKWIEAQNTYDFVERDFARQLERELSEKTNEVARLRELLERALPWLEAYDCGNTPCTCDGLEELIMDIK